MRKPRAWRRAGCSVEAEMCEHPLTKRNKVRFLIDDTQRSMSAYLSPAQAESLSHRLKQFAAWAREQRGKR